MNINSKKVTRWKQEALPGSPEQSAVLLKPKAHTAAPLITQVSIETTSAASTGPEP